MASPITYVKAADQQHMLFLFFPLKKSAKSEAVEKASHLQHLIMAHADAATAPGDLRASTGVHFFLFYHLSDGQNPGLPVPSFQTFPGKDLLVVQSIYDADFAPYISSFVNVPAIAQGLNGILMLMDENGIPGVDPKGPTSASFILANGGVEKNPAAFFCLLMRYNFADPTIPAATSSPKGQKYILGGTFPGLTIGKILQNYPNAAADWPFPPVEIEFAKSVKPTC
jgi:hypothetical protein